jgi:hypothetical protein
MPKAAPKSKIDARIAWRKKQRFAKKGAKK